MSIMNILFTGEERGVIRRAVMTNWESSILPGKESCQLSRNSQFAIPEVERDLLGRSLPRCFEVGCMEVLYPRARLCWGRILAAEEEEKPLSPLP